MSSHLHAPGLGPTCTQHLQQIVASSDQILWVAFAPGGTDRYVILLRDGAPIVSSGVPQACKDAINWFMNRKTRPIRVAFTPEGAWVVLDITGGRLYSDGFPQSCRDSIENLSQNDVKVIHVAFSPFDRNAWIVVNEKGTVGKGNISPDLDSKMNELKRGGVRKIKSVTWTTQRSDSNSWVVVNDGNEWWIRADDWQEPQMYFKYYSGIYGPIRVAAWDPNGKGWIICHDWTIHETYSDGTNTVVIQEFYQNLINRLAGNCTGFAITFGKDRKTSFALGSARTSADGTEKMMYPWTKIQVASVTKILTGITAIKTIDLILENWIDKKVVDFLPADWDLDPLFKQITFRQCLTETSGITMYGNPHPDEAEVKAFWTQKNPNLKNFDSTKVGTYVYSNFNFSIFRILLPSMLDVPNDAAYHSSKFAELVQQHVFDPLDDVSGLVEARPPGFGLDQEQYAFAYNFPGTSKGFDWGDNVARTGASGYWLSIQDMMSVLYSLNKDDGKVLSHDQLQRMKSGRLGLDNTSWGNAYPWYEKNGGLTASDTNITTTASLIGDTGGMYASLFVNSNITGPRLQSSWFQCTTCDALIFGGNAVGKCVTGNNHSFNKTSPLGVSQGGDVLPTAEKEWRWCNKCTGMWYAGTTSTGPCVAGGTHNGSLGNNGSGNYGIPIRPHGNRPRGEFTTGWGKCSKCLLLTVRRTTNLSCVAGGLHDFSAGTLDYMVSNATYGARAILVDAWLNAMKP